MISPVAKEAEMGARVETADLVRRRIRWAGLVVLVLVAAGVPQLVRAATPPVPTISGLVTSPGPIYPNPPVTIVASAVKVEDFPYVTEEFFVSGTANGAPYTTRIIVLRPTNVGDFSGVAVT